MGDLMLERPGYIYRMHLRVRLRDRVAMPMMNLECPIPGNLDQECTNPCTGQPSSARKCALDFVLLVDLDIAYDARLASRACYAALNRAHTIR